MNPKKLYGRILHGDVANVRFADLIRLVEALDYESRRVQGDHHLFKHPGIDRKLNLQPDSSGDAKSYQIRQVGDAIRKYDLRLED